MITSVTSGPSQRQSNFELLRILAMFFVLVVHADFNALEIPNRADILDTPAQSFFRILIEFTAIISVNLFVLISGWFGIRPTIRGFLKLIFQVVFFGLAIYGLSLIMGRELFSLKDLWHNATIGFRPELWFVPAYIGLYILSPVLNIFVANAPERLLRNVILAFIAFEVLIEWVILNYSPFMMGYNTMAFVVLYLLAQWLRKFGNAKIQTSMAWLLFIIPIVINTLICFFCRKNNVPLVTSLLICYNNPLVIIQSAALLVLFARLRPFSSRLINWISSGVFSVYLVNCNPYIYTKYKYYCEAIFYQTSGFLSLLGLLAFILVFLIGCVIIDKLIREPIWNLLSLLFGKNSYGKPKTRI